jgi:hypothetical protein
MIVAKPVVPDQYWILRDGDVKIGNIQAEPGGFSVRIHDHVQKFKNLPTIKRKVAIDFERSPQKSKPKSAANEIYGYPTTHPPHNAIYDVRHQVPLWTREDRSKSWLAAGWYRVKQGRAWTVVECPKLIMLERYPYQGPFRSQQEAQTA